MTTKRHEEARARDGLTLAAPSLRSSSAGARRAVLIDTGSGGSSGCPPSRSNGRRTVDALRRPVSAAPERATRAGEARQGNNSTQRRSAPTLPLRASTDVEFGPAGGQFLALHGRSLRQEALQQATSERMATRAGWPLPDGRGVESVGLTPKAAALQREIERLAARISRNQGGQPPSTEAAPTPQPEQARPRNDAASRLSDAAGNEATRALQGSASGKAGSLADLRVDVVLREPSSEGGAPVAVRPSAAADVYADRLSLDNRGLRRCCLLQGETRLRLLSYQHNAIEAVEHLDGLPSLVFLDFYANQLTALSGLAATPNLRVLMLGRNRLTSLAGLESLSQLDVLDVHHNAVSSLEPLRRLEALRILNASGNNVAQLCDLSGLRRLVELNLRRNDIQGLTLPDAEASAPASATHMPPLLQRLFLGQNRIAEMSGLRPLRLMTQLRELALDDCRVPLCANKEEARRQLLSCCPASLTVLNGVSVMGDEALLLAPSPGNPPDRGKAADTPLAGVARDMPNADSEASEAPAALPTEATAAVSLVSCAPSQFRPASAPVSPSWRPLSALPGSAADAAPPPPAAAHPSPISDGDVLIVTASTLPSLHAPICATVRELRFVDVHHTSVTAQLPAVQALSRLRSLRCVRCDMRTLSHVAPLSALTRLTQLALEGDPVVHARLLRPFVVCVMPGLEVFNDEAVSERDRSAALAMQPLLHFVQAVKAPVASAAEGTLASESSSLSAQEDAPSRKNARELTSRQSSSLQPLGHAAGPRRSSSRPGASARRSASAGRRSARLLATVETTRGQHRMEPARAGSKSAVGKADGGVPTGLDVAAGGAFSKVSKAAACDAAAVIVSAICDEAVEAEKRQAELDDVWDDIVVELTRNVKPCAG